MLQYPWIILQRNLTFANACYLFNYVDTSRCWVTIRPFLKVSLVYCRLLRFYASAKHNIFREPVLIACKCRIIIVYMRVCYSSSYLHKIVLPIGVFSTNAIHRTYSWAIASQTFSSKKKKLLEITLRCFFMQILSRRRTTYSESSYLVFVFLSIVELNSGSIYILH